MFYHIYRVLIVEFIGHTHLHFVVYLVDIYPNLKQCMSVVWKNTT